MNVGLQRQADTISMGGEIYTMGANSRGPFCAYNIIEFGIRPVATTCPPRGVGM